MSESIARRLAAARRRRVVGRDAELALFRDTLGADELPVVVLNLFGPGGIGKTTLVRAFAEHCAEVGVPCHLIDGRVLEATPEAFAAAAAPLQTFDEGRRTLLVDTYELLEPLEGWLRDAFLPGLSADTLVVLAGRNPVSAQWRGDMGWQELTRLVPLRNLDPEACRALLTERAIPEAQQEAILALTHGYPLALTLATEMAAVDPRAVASEPSPDMVRALLERFVTKVPTPDHRGALEVCALVRVTTEPILQNALETDDARTAELFSWLRDLSFVDPDHPGLSPHAVARDALVADLKWRNPDRYADLHRRIRDYYAARLERSPDSEQQAVLWDYIYLHRESPVVRNAFTWSDTISAYADPARDVDFAALRAMTERWEGPESAALMEAWWDDPAAAFTVVRAPDGGEILGYLTRIALERADPDRRDRDPATRNAWTHLQRHTPLRPGETASHFRFWMDRDGYHGVSPVQSRLMVEVVRHYLATRGLAHSFFPVVSPDHWAPIFAYAETPRCSDADFQVGERAWGVFSHDWREQPPAAWLAALGEKELQTVGRTPPPARSESILVLSEAEFASAVRDALKHLDHAEGLTRNPLLRSRLIVGKGGTGHPALRDRAETLQRLIRDAIDARKSIRKQERGWRALERTYLNPAATQEKAAEALDLPFSTYRRHLGEGIGHVVAALWQREIGAGLD